MANYCSNRDPEPTYSPGLGSPLSYQTPTGQVLPSRLHTSFDSDLLSQFAPEHPGLSPKPGEILSSRHTGWFNTLKSISIIYQINRPKMKTHMIISIDTGKTYDKIQHPSLIKTLRKTGIQENFLNLLIKTYTHTHTHTQPTIYLTVKD